MGKIAEHSVSRASYSSANNPSSFAHLNFAGQINRDTFIKARQEYGGLRAINKYHTSHRDRTADPMKKGIFTNPPVILSDESMQFFSPRHEFRLLEEKT